MDKSKRMTEQAKKDVRAKVDKATKDRKAKDQANRQARQAQIDRLRNS